MTECIKDSELIELIGWGAFDDWTELRCAIEDRYDVGTVWNVCADCGKIECKYTVGGKTLCTLCVNDKNIGVTVAFDKTECEKAGAVACGMSEQISAAYAAAPENANGKTVALPIEEPIIDDIIKLLEVKRKFDK